MKFSVVPRFVPDQATSSGFLISDRWDDWGKFQTQFYLVIFDDQGVRHEVGNVKVGEIGLKPHGTIGVIPPGHRSPAIPTEFESLGPMFFSLGQGDHYYVALSKLRDSERTAVLRALRDVAFDASIWESVKEEYVTRESLLRAVSESEVEVQWRCNRNCVNVER